MSNKPIDPVFNVQETKEKRTVAGIETESVTELAVETALPLILTQDENKANQPNHLYIPESATIRVFADELTVSGNLRVPGRNVVIFARVLRTQANGTIAPAINVDGAELPEEVGKPPALEKGASPPDNPTKKKRAKGEKGADGYNQRVPSFPLPSDKEEPGQPGWSATDHAAEMNGEPGRQGEKGLAAGNVWICCYKTDFGDNNQKLRITAIGGPGGAGQPGQDGADGGDGGHGCDLQVYAFGTQAPNKGGDGGQGGQAGNGGQGGQGGDGGNVVFHCIASAPSVLITCDGGKGGAAGDCGKPGKGGEPGPGGRGGYGGGGGTVLKIEDASDGKPGLKGNNGAKGAEAPASHNGTSSITSGPVVTEELAKRASVSQLQMLFDHTRADYLVTEPPAYQLYLTSVASIEDLVDDGTSLVVIALVGATLNIRIFDADGNKVVDKAENAFTNRDKVAALRERFAYELIEVLLAGSWCTQAQLETMSAADQRGALIEKLTQYTIEPADYYKNLSQYDLIGIGAALAFLQGTEIWAQKHLQKVNPHNLTILLIDSFARRTRDVDTPRKARDAIREIETSISRVPGSRRVEDFDNQKLVRLALQHGNGPFVLNDSLSRLRDCPFHLSEADQQQILGDVGLTVGYSDLWTSIGERLRWAVSLLNGIPSQNPQKSLATTILASAWSALTNYIHDLDYYGKTPSFAPVVSLDTYHQALEKSLEQLKFIEQQKDNYFQALSQNKNATSELAAALRSAEGHLSFLSTRRGEIRDKLKKTGEIIDELDRRRKTTQPALNTLLETLAKEISNAFGLSVPTFFNCLSQLSFVNVHEPANAIKTFAKVSGYASAASMAVSQFGAIFNEATENVLNDSGEPVKKNLVLKQIEVISNDLNLQSEFTKRANGFLSNDTPYRLLVELDKFRDLCKEFYNSLPDAPTVRQKLDVYIELIAQRNRNIDYYNALLRELLDLSGEVNKISQQKMAVQGNIAQQAQPGLPAMATFVSGVYERAKAECLSALCHAYRAYAFWALEPYSGFYDLIGRTPSAINAVQLASATIQITANLTASLEKARRTPNIFPPREESESSIGCVVVLTRERHKGMCCNFGGDDW
jgi:hypothetical protein